MSTKSIEVNEESINKAYETLGIDMSSLEKAKKTKKEDDDEKEEDEEMEKEKGDKDKLQKGELEKLVEQKRDELRKAEESLALLNGKSTLEKSQDNTQVVDAVNKLGKDLGDRFSSMALLNKAMEDQLSEMSDRLEKAEGKIKEYEEAPLDRKSITTQGYIEKAFQENEDTGKKMLSISQHKREIQGLLIEKAGLNEGDVLEKGVTDTFWNNEMLHFEATGGLRIRAIEKLFKDDNIQIVK